MNYLKQFQYVIAIAQEESISRAAEKLGIAQPTMSKYISKLESELGIELFDRNTIPLKLTQAGECFVLAGIQMMDIDRQMNKKLSSIRENNALEIRIGVGVSRSMYLLPGILSEFRKTNPKNRVVIEEGITVEISSALLSGKLDMAISLLDENTAQFERVKLFDETVLLAVHGDFEGAVRSAMCDEGVDLKKISNVPFVTLGEGQYLRNLFNALCDGDTVPAYECQNLESAIALVRSGMGITLVPSYIRDYGVNRNDSSLVFYELTPQTDKKIESMLDRKVCVFYRKGQFLSQAEHDLIACCKKVCGTAYNE